MTWFKRLYIPILILVKWCWKQKNHIIGIVVFVSALVTIYGVIVIYPETVLIYKQLQQINTQAKINIKFELATSSISYNSQMIGPIPIKLLAQNNGDRISSYWRAGLVFCKGVSVKEKDANWTLEMERQYSFESQKLIPPHFPNRVYLYSPGLDNIGDFVITLPNTNKNTNKEELFNPPIRIGMVIISGDYPTPDNYLVLLGPKGFIYESLLEKNGMIRNDYDDILNDCLEVIIRLNNI